MSKNVIKNNVVVAAGVEDTSSYDSTYTIINATGGAVGDFWDGESYFAPGTVEQIKAEAQRRIDAIAPIFKQINAAGDAIAMQKKLIEGGTLTPEESSKLTYYEQVKSEIDQVRTKSDELEAMDPIPGNYKDDSYWT